MLVEGKACCHVANQQVYFAGYRLQIAGQSDGRRVYFYDFK